MIRIRQAAFASVFALVLLHTAAALAGTPRADWPTWGNGNARTGVATVSSIRANNASHLVKAWSHPLDGASTAQPLYIRDPKGGVFVTATNAGTLQAWSATTGAQVWKASLGTENTSCAQLPKKQFGITGTPVYDRSTQTIYVVAHGVLNAIDAQTGQEQAGWPLVLPFDPFQNVSWGALTLVGKALYLGTAAFCDVQPWKGRVMRVDLVSHQTTEFDPVPTAGNNGGGGVWGWGGVSVDPKTGHIWAVTANAAGPDAPTDGVYDAESIVELDPVLQKVQSAHAPGMPPHGDYGFGSTPALFTPTGCPPMAAAESKNGSLYVWNRTNLKLPPQRLWIAFPATLFGLPAWDPRTQQVFVSTTQGYKGYLSGLLAFRIGPGCKLQLAWRRGLGSALDSVPTVANDTVMVNTGIGKLRIFNATTGKPLYTGVTNGATFAPPTAVGDYVATASYKQVTLFRLGKP
jgi:outer membrane protein assembly factor BamB